MRCFGERRPPHQDPPSDADRRGAVLEQVGQGFPRGLVDGEALTGRSVVMITRRPGLLSVTEADIDDGERGPAPSASVSP
jgi:hypothetical protein